MAQHETINTPSDVLRQYLVHKESHTFDHAISEQGEVRPCSVPEVTFDNHLIVLPLAGKLKTNFSADGLTSKRHTCSPGHISIYPAGTSTQCDLETDKNYQYNCLQLKTEAVDRAIAEVVDLSHFELSPIFGAEDPFIESILSQIASKGEIDTPLDRLYIDSLTNSLVLHLLQHHATRRAKLTQHEGGLSRSQLNRTIAYIQAHLQQDIKLTDLADLLGMSQYYFCRLFRQSMGVSPYKYVIQQRIERAKTLLQDPDRVSIADIALECGFANQSHLCKHFRKVTGTTPKAYRKR